MRFTEFTFRIRRTAPLEVFALSPFTESDWKFVLAQLTVVLGPEAERYAALPAARLLGALPYLAGSEDPDRFAVSNLLTFHAAAKARALFDHRPSDDGDIFRRLATIHVGNRADPHIVDYGLTLLALISLNDHDKDQAADRLAGKYNPVVAGKWDPVTLRKDLWADLERSAWINEAFVAAVGSDVTDLAYWSPTS